MIQRLFALIVTAWLGAGVAEAADLVAYVTEIHRKGSGQAAVRLGTESEWKPAQPLLGLRAEDQVRATGETRLVILFHAGGGVATVTAANSPFTVSAPSVDRTSERLRVVTASVMEFFLGKQGGPTFRRAATRGEATVIVSPRHTRLFPGPLSFEWEGAENARYTLRVSGPAGVVWQQRDVPRASITYPASAPTLAPGARYIWEVVVRGQIPQQTMFEILSDTEARRVRAALDLLERETQAYPRGTAVVVRAALLFEEGLFTEARRDLERAAAAHPDEPTIRLMLAYVYHEVGLGARASQAFEQARRIIEQ